MSQYDPKFYDAIREGCRRSAAVVAPIVTSFVHPRTVVDVGCGEGWWGAAFLDAGATSALGIDSGICAQMAPIDRLDHDLRQPIEVAETFDLAVCLEVAEHLPAASAGRLVADLVTLAPVVLFSAAMPRQGGTGHINCQPPAYWADLFATHGYECHDLLRRRLWNDDDVEVWYRTNMLIFADPEQADLGRPDPALHLIHPDLWLQPR